MSDDHIHSGGDHNGGGESGQTDDPSSSSTVIIGVVGTVLLFVVVIWLQAIFNKELQSERLSKQVLPRVVSLDDFEAGQQAVLHGYGWVDSEKGVVHIPIERAMELTVRELSGDREGG